MLLGGGTDVDKAFVWMITNSGGGDIVVLRASGTDAYNEYIYGLGRVNSVSTIICKSKSASTDAFVLERIENSEGLFFSGGDQWLYYSYWKNTPVQTAVNTLITTKRVTIGGTSAGMAIMSQFVYTAEFNTVTSPEALADPYTRTVTIGNNFINQQFLQNVITDTHFYARDRMGRLITFIARMEQDGLVSKAARAVACDEGTAVLLSDSGYGQVVTQGSSGVAYFLYATVLPEICRAGSPLSFSNIEVHALKDGDEFDFVSWSSSAGRLYSITADKGSLSSQGNGGSIY